MKINSISQYNKYNGNTLKNSKAPTFKGGVSLPIKEMSKFYTKLADTKGFQNVIKNFSKSNRTFTHLLTMESIFLSGFYMIGTLTNKKIKKEQKPQMVINDTLTLGVSTAGAYLLDDKVSSFVNKFTEHYFAKHSDFYKKLGAKTKEAEMGKLLEKVSEAASQTGEKAAQGVDDVVNLMSTQLKNIVGEEGKTKAFQITHDKLDEVAKSVKVAITDNKGNCQKAAETVKGIVDDVYSKSAARIEANNSFGGFNKLKTLVLFGIIYRYLGPVVVTPIANKLSSKLFDKSKKECNKDCSKSDKPKETANKK